MRDDFIRVEIGINPLCQRTAYVSLRFFLCTLPQVRKYGFRTQAREMNDTVVIQRYLFVGTNQPFYIQKNQPFDIKAGCRVLALIRTLVEAVEKPNDPAARRLADSVNLAEPPVDTVSRVSNIGMVGRGGGFIFLSCRQSSIFFFSQSIAIGFFSLCLPAVDGFV